MRALKLLSVGVRPQLLGCCLSSRADGRSARRGWERACASASARDLALFARASASRASSRLLRTFCSAERSVTCIAGSSRVFPPPRVFTARRRHTAAAAAQPGPELDTRGCDLHSRPKTQHSARLELSLQLSHSRNSRLSRLRRLRIKPAGAALAQSACTAAGRARCKADCGAVRTAEDRGTAHTKGISGPLAWPLRAVTRCRRHERAQLVPQPALPLRRLPGGALIVRMLLLQRPVGALYWETAQKVRAER